MRTPTISEPNIGSIHIDDYFLHTEKGDVSIEERADTPCVTHSTSGLIGERLWMVTTGNIYVAIATILDDLTISCWKYRLRILRIGFSVK